MYLMSDNGSIVKISPARMFSCKERYASARQLRIRNDVNSFSALFMIYWGQVEEELPRISEKLGIDDYENWLVYMVENHLYVRPNIKMSIANQKRVAKELGYETCCYKIPKYLDQCLMEEIGLDNLIQRYWIGERRVDMNWGLLTDKEKQEYDDYGLEEIVDLKSYEMLCRAVRD